MKHEFETTPSIAHRLTKEMKKNGFYYRTLTRTDHNEFVICETTDPGMQYIEENKIPINKKSSKS